jgi:acetyl-CoA carboxylase biotin carboxylase subunit
VIRFPGMFRKILIANRGEIAVRVLRACREMDIPAVTVFSEADRGALHVRLADEAYRIGPSPSNESYLVIEKLLGVAKHARCDALHPGYGFLAENAGLARACAEAEITFIGPPPEAIERLGSKTAARQLALEIGVPTVPGTIRALETLEQVREAVETIGFPVLMKAVAGGGGKGMRLVAAESELAAAWRDASSEAKNAFGDARVYLEKFIAQAHHVEFQVMADAYGHVIYLGDRECSVQRRYQKVIEEAPSPILDEKVRREMGEAAVRLARAGGYQNAGTAEFLVDADKEFYFLEMNTRLQVEHPVTEMVTSLDLVKLQIRVAAGEPLPITQQAVQPRGHAIECRLYAEDPDNNFMPSPGKIRGLQVPGGPGIRVDDGVYNGWMMPTDYDPMLGKLIVWGCDRAEAIARLRGALGEYYAGGIRTNVKLFQRILNESDFLQGSVHTKWLDALLARPAQSVGESDGGARDAVTLVAALWWMSHSTGTGASVAATATGANSKWKEQGRHEQIDRWPRG